MKKAIRELELCDHTFLLFNDQMEFMHCLIPFIREGINKNQKCMIVTDEIKREDIIRNFKLLFSPSLNPFDYLASNKTIEICNFNSVYLQEGKFDIWKLKEKYLGVANDCLKEGFTGLRVFAEISSSMKKLVNEENFYKWETFIDNYFKSENFLAVCAYNKKYFSAKYTDKMCKAHPIEIDLVKTRL